MIIVTMLEYLRGNCMMKMEGMNEFFCERGEFNDGEKYQTDQKITMYNNLLDQVFQK